MRSITYLFWALLTYFGQLQGSYFNHAYLAPTVLRDYLTVVTPEEEKDIGYIVNTLGMGSLAKIAKAKSSLKRAGDRIDHIHPLRFLSCIFTHEEMKVSLHAMQSRGWVWEEFYNGLKKSLEEESAKDNMRVEMIADFSLLVGLSFDQVYSPIEGRKWRQFLDILIQYIPRTTQKKRYDW